MIITDEKVQSALAFLHERAEEYGKARAAHEWAEKNEKTVLARLMSLSDAKTVSAKDTEARCHTDYLSAVEHTRLLAETVYTLRAKREAASAIVEAWRTEQSNERAHVRTSQMRKAS
jgi:hypothetical protein